MYFEFFMKFQLTKNLFDKFQLKMAQHDVTMWMIRLMNIFFLRLRKKIQKNETKKKQLGPGTENMIKNNVIIQI